MPKSMSIDVIEVGDFITNCYLIYEADQAIILDPGDDAPQIIELIEKRNVKLDKIILTHGHIDHIKGLPELRHWAKVPVLIHQEDANMLTEARKNLSYYHDTAFTTKPADELLVEGDEITVGNNKFTVLHTPGHTPGGISLLTDGIVFSGDALFFGSIGRTDFPGSDHRTLIEAIQHKLMTLPPETVVYPGHGPQTTIGQEKEANPWLS